MRILPIVLASVLAFPAMAADAGDLLGDTTPAPAPAATAQAALTPRADEAARREALAKLKKTYAADYARRDARDKPRFGRRLLRDAAAQRADAAMYEVMLTEAIRLAGDGDDLQLALDGLAGMAATFAGWDDLAEKRAVLRRLFRRPAAAAMAKLLDTPDDPRANATAGKWYAFTAERWDLARPMLDRSGDAALMELSRMETAAPVTTPERIQLAEAWHELARKTPAGDDRIGMLSRAEYWYRQASGTAAGDEAAKVKAALAQILPQIPLDTDKADWAALTASDWERIQAPVITVQAKHDRTDAQAVLGERQAVRVVPHPADTWSFGVYDLPTKVVCTWKGQATTAAVLSNNNRGQIVGQPSTGGGNTRGTRSVVLGIAGQPYGSLLMWLNPNERLPAGVMVGPGKLWLGPSTDRTAESDSAGTIRVKLVVVDPPEATPAAAPVVPVPAPAPSPKR